MDNSNQLNMALLDGANQFYNMSATVHVICVILIFLCLIGLIFGDKKI